MELGSGVVDKKRAPALARAIHLSVGCFYRRMDGGDAWERKEDTIPEMYSRWRARMTDAWVRRRRDD